MLCLHQMGPDYLGSKYSSSIEPSEVNYGSEARQRSLVMLDSDVFEQHEKL